MLFRQIERWLHQHIFKVGWLLTQNFQTTTILYYTFFLPGVVLHEAIYWLMAGILDVRAERAIQWPEKQEIGELKLNFIKLSNRAGRIKTAIISSSPVIVGMIIIWYIGSQILNISETFGVMNSGDLGDIASGVGQLTTTPDFWLWFYLAFVIGNTMIPANTSQLRGWWIVAIASVVILIALVVIGIGSQIFSAVSVPLFDGLNILAGILALLIGINIAMTLILGTIEAMVERFTGRSATFRSGKMIVMSREEVLTQREQERRRARQRPTRKETATGPPTIYRFPLPIPDVPGKEPVTRAPAAVVEPPRPEAIPSTAGTRAGASFIERGKSAAATDTSESPAARTPLAQPGARPSEPLIRQAQSLRASSTSEERSLEADKTDLKRPVPTRPALPSPTSGTRATGTDDDDTDDKKPATDLRSRLGTPIGQPASRPSPFSARPSATEDDEDDDIEDDGEDKPAASLRPRPASPFGQPAPRSSPFSARPAATDDDKDEDFDDEDKDEPAASLRPRPASPFGQPASRPSPFSARSAATEDDEDDDIEDDGEDKPAASLRPRPASPFGQPASRPSSFSARPTTTVDDEDEDEGDDFDDEDDGEIVYEDEDDYVEDEDDDEDVDATSRLGAFSQRPSLFATSRPFTPPRPGTSGSFLSRRLQNSSAEDEEDGDDDDVSYEDVDDSP